MNHTGLISLAKRYDNLAVYWANYSSRPTSQHMLDSANCFAIAAGIRALLKENPDG